MAEDPHPASDSSALSSREYILYSVFCMLRNPMTSNYELLNAKCTSRDKTKNEDCNENKIRYWISVSVSDPNIEYWYKKRKK